MSLHVMLMVGSPVYLFAHTLGYGTTVQRAYDNWCGAVTSTYYSDCDSLTTSCYLYTDAAGTTYATNGWYSCGSESMQVVSGVISSTSSPSFDPECDPGCN